MKSVTKTLAVLATLFMMLVGAAVAQSKDAEAPDAQRLGGQATISTQMNAFKSRDHAKAFNQATPNLQKLFGSTDRFTAMVKNGYNAIYDARGWSFGRSRMKDGDLYQELLVSGPDGREWIALYTMQQQADGSWKIGGVRIIPGTGAST